MWNGRGDISAAASPRPSDPAAAWTLDEAFIASVLRQAAAVDLVSLDVFDTALTRRVDSPADAFAEMERVLSNRIGAPATGFAQAREDAERRARILAHRQGGPEDIDLAAIHARLPEPFLPHLASIRAVELEVETSLLLPVPDILELTRRLAARDRPFLFVSDMYLPTGFIADRLSAAGYAGWTSLHVSAETGATKATGRQWTHVARRHPDRCILHVGDDEQADLLIPRRHGIATMLYTRARSERRVGGPLSPALVPFSLAQRDTVLRSRAIPDHVPDAGAFWRDLGRVLGGIVLAGFVRWLEPRVRRHGIDRLHFCARDGWLLQQAWRAAGADRRTGIPDHYLCISRRSLNLAHGHAGSTPDRLSQPLLSFLSSTDGGIGIRAVLARAGLGGEIALAADLQNRFGSLDVRLTWPDGTQILEQVLQSHAPAVHAALAPLRDALMGYLRQERFCEEGRTGLVDLGWHANLQRSLRSLIEAGAEVGADPRPIQLRGFYYGLWTAATGNRYAAGPMEAAFASDFMPAESQESLHGSVEILEELHGAPHGTTVSYARDGDRWTPVFADSPRERAQYEAITRPFQEGALETVATLFATGKAGPLRLDDITPDAVRAALAAVCMSPTTAELAALGGIGHCATFDHALFEPLCVPCPDDQSDWWPVLRRCGWRLGSLRHWIDTATPDRAALLRGWAHEVLPHYGARTLRQF